MNSSLLRIFIAVMWWWTVKSCKEKIVLAASFIDIEIWRLDDPFWVRVLLLSINKWNAWVNFCSDSSYVDLIDSVVHGAVSTDKWRRLGQFTGKWYLKAVSFGCRSFGPFSVTCRSIVSSRGRSQQTKRNNVMHFEDKWALWVFLHWLPLRPIAVATTSDRKF